MPLPLVVVDAFADGPFRGNPAAVCLLDQWRPEAWLQSVAAEMNLSETAFLLPRGAGEWDLRWFTPTVEVDLCGHATLASAHALHSVWGDRDREGRRDELCFHTRSGELRARVDDGIVVIDLPLTATETIDATAIRDCFDVAPRYVGRAGVDLLVELDDAAAVRGYTPDMAKLQALDCRGLIVTAASDDPRFDFISRFFAPKAGIPEDPVTGSAHCALGPYWSQRLGRRALNAWQASRRGGALALEVGEQRIHLAGRAVTTVEGWLRV